MRPHPSLALVALLAPLAAIGGCHERAPESADVAARVDDRVVPYARFEEYLRAQVGEAAGGLDSPVLSGLFDQFVGEELLTRLAIDEGRVPPTARHREAVQALLVDADESVPTAAVEAWYRQHSESFTLSERVRLRHLLVATRADAEEARRRIESGEDFGDVARAMSLDPSAAAGGDQGELALEDLPAPFAAHVGSLQPAEVGEPLQASDGWHLFQVLELLPLRQRELVEVAPEIEARLRQEQGDALLARRLAEATDRYNVVVYVQNLPFDYRGEHAREPGGDRP